MEKEPAENTIVEEMVCVVPDYVVEKQDAEKEQKTIVAVEMADKKKIVTADERNSSSDGEKEKSVKPTGVSYVAAPSHIEDEVSGEPKEYVVVTDASDISHFGSLEASPVPQLNGSPQKSAEACLSVSSQLTTDEGISKPLEPTIVSTQEVICSIPVIESSTADAVSVLVASSAHMEPVLEFSASSNVGGLISQEETSTIYLEEVESGAAQVSVCVVSPCDECTKPIETADALDLTETVAAVGDARDTVDEYTKEQELQEFKEICVQKPKEEIGIELLVESQLVNEAEKSSEDEKKKKSEPVTCVDEVAEKEVVQADQYNVTEEKKGEMILEVLSASDVYNVLHQELCHENGNSEEVLEEEAVIASASKSAAFECNNDEKGDIVDEGVGQLHEETIEEKHKVLSENSTPAFDGVAESSAAEGGTEEHDAAADMELNGTTTQQDVITEVSEAATEAVHCNDLSKNNQDPEKSVSVPVAPLTPISSYVVLESQPSGAVEATEAAVEEPPVYCVKWILWKGVETPIVTQNVNGPCPLLAIANVLLLKRQITLPAKAEIVTSARLLEMIGDTVIESVPKNIVEADKTNYEQNVSDVLGILPKLQSGIDVNVKFTGIGDFEYTPELALFDLVHIPLYHGWLVDRGQQDEVEAVGNCGYNQLVERIITAKSQENQDLFLKAEIAEAFLERSASQLTYQGLLDLASTVQEDELAVFFRNNHFSTLYKTHDQLFTLMTDQGLLQEPKVVWETLQDIDGSGQFVDANFLLDGKPFVNFTKDEQIGRDFQIAAQLQREADELHETSRLAGDSRPLTDEQLARQLQEEEEKRARPGSSGSLPGPSNDEARKSPTPTQVPPKKEEKKSFCALM